MSKKLDDDRAHVFILRLWHEPGSNDDTAPEWRALIENVSTNTRYPIKDMAILQTLLAIFEDETGLDKFLASQNA